MKEQTEHSIAVNTIFAVLVTSVISILVYSCMISKFDESVEYVYQRGDGDSRIIVTAEIVEDSTFKIESVLEQQGKAPASEKIYIPLSQAYRERFVVDFYLGTIRLGCTIKTERVLAELFLRSREQSIYSELIFK